MNAQRLPAISKKILRMAQKDIVRATEAVNLIYVSDREPGYSRKRSGKQFNYYLGPKKITDEKILQRIRQLVIPPAWEKVWICVKENGHLQATGYDKRMRKQYRYHIHWNLLRSHTKFDSLLRFGKQLPCIRDQLQRDLALSGYPQKKVLAAVVSLIDHTGIRIGNSAYEKLYGSFGLSTLTNRHAKIVGSRVHFAFTGKKGIAQRITLKSRKLSRIVKACQEIPGKKLFEFYDEQGEVHPIDSGLVNDYIRELSGEHFTAKDFRTWHACTTALSAFLRLPVCDNESQRKVQLNTVLDEVAKQLGNTRAVCKKYYVHPQLIQLHETGELLKFSAIPAGSKGPISNEETEQMLLNMLSHRKR